MASGNNCPDEAVGRLHVEDYRMEPSSPNEQSTSSAPDTGPKTTPLPVPPSGNTDTHPTSTEWPAPESPATASPQHIQLVKSMAWLGDLVVEAVFPAVALIRWTDWLVSRNEVAMRLLREGEILRGMDGLQLIAGSLAEGVAVEEGWGHPQADRDNMDLYGGDLAVGVDGPGELPPGGVTLRYRGEGCPPAYTRLEVVDRDRLVEAINRESRNEEVPAHTCLEEEGGGQWLLSSHLLDAMRHTLTPTIRGPAVAGGARWPP